MLAVTQGCCILLMKVNQKTRPYSMLERLERGPKYQRIQQGTSLESNSHINVLEMDCSMDQKGVSLKAKRIGIHLPYPVQKYLEAKLRHFQWMERTQIKKTLLEIRDTENLRTILREDVNIFHLINSKLQIINIQKYNS